MSSDGDDTRGRLGAGIVALDGDEFVECSWKSATLSALTWSNSSPKSSECRFNVDGDM